MPWEIIFNIVLSFFGFLLNKRTSNIEAKKAWYLFLDTMNHLGISSVTLNEADQAQIDELKARRNKGDI